MYLHQNELTIRDALPADALLLCRWWNDGKVMEHAGFPQGLGTSVEKITHQLLEPNDPTHRLIIEAEGLPIGEMNWRREESDHAEIGIKICESNRQEKGFGSRLIAMLCRDLFANRGIARITLDTMLENQRAQQDRGDEGTAPDAPHLPGGHGVPLGQADQRFFFIHASVSPPSFVIIMPT